MFMASLSITFIFSVPIFVVGGSVYCHYLIGPWCFVAIGVWIITYLVMVNILLRHKAGQEGRGEILLENSFMR